MDSIGGFGALVLPKIPNCAVLFAADFEIFYNVIVYEFGKQSRYVGVVYG